MKKQAPPPPDKLRAKIESDIQEFLNKGGEITQVEKGLSGAKPRKYGVSINTDADNNKTESSNVKS